MHIHSEREKVPNDNSTKMSTAGGVDVRLRRQQPVAVKPPRLRLGTRALSSHLQQQQSSQKQQQQLSQQRPSSWHPSHGVSKQVAGISSEEKAGIPLDSSNENKKSGIAHTGNANEGARGASRSSGRPLIPVHHQRHNLKNRFQLLKTLGEGTYGKVKLAADRGTGEHVAIKYIKKTKIQDENDLVRIRREIQILSSLRHKHIVNIREVFEKKDKIVLVMDYAQGGELYDYLNKMGKLSELEARRIFRQIVSALHYCHQNGIVHRDLKLENIILDDEGNVKIADFGLSNYYSHNSTLRTFCGSPLYASPEIVNGKPYHGPEVDVWSLGVILYTLVYGAMPFESNSLVSLKQQISDGDYNQPSKPSDAAGLIRHMLTVTPSRRATMEDALRHWWINFGHSNMPNDMPYSPDEEAPIMPYTLTADSHAMSTTQDPPLIIHHRNQSSISSDSDVELDFKPSRWTKRSQPLDSTGNSLSSSGACSPAPVADLCNISTDDNDEQDDPAAIASGLLKLPPDVLEILRGCSSKSLAALLNTDKISNGFDLDNSNNDNINNPMCQNTEEENREETAESEKMSSSVFDSERKPKRGILKRKGKFSGGDSGCVMPEEMTARPEENPIPKSGHLPRRLPSFKDEANGIFASKHRASQLLDNAASLQYESCSSAIAHSPWCSSPRSQRHQQHSQQQQQQHDHQQHHQHQPRIYNPTAPRHSQASPSQQPPAGFCLPETLTVHSTDATIDLQNANLPAPQAMPNDSGIQSLQVSHKQETSQSAGSHSRDSSYDEGANKDPAKVIHRPKSILKNSKMSQMEQARNRLSLSSVGSNSSADFLDLSYDSGDSDHFVNQALQLSPDSDETGGLVMKPLPISDQEVLCAEQNNSTINDNSRSVPFVSHQRTLSDEEILDSKSSLLYRLTRDAQQNLV